MRPRHPRATLLVFSLVFILLGVACADPADPVALGELCFPSDEACPTRVDLNRPAAGRNYLEFSIHNQGADSTVRLRATTTQQLEFSQPRSETEDGVTILVDRNFPLGYGEVLRDSFTAQQLTIARDFALEVICLQGDCDTRVEYLLFSEAVECFDNGACGRNEICEVTAGRCVDCVNDSTCTLQQTCDLDTGTCFPGSSTGCSSSSPSAPTEWFFVLVAVGLILFFRRRRAQQAFLAATVATILLAFAQPAQANTGANASISAGGGARFLSGELRPLTRTGWGIAVHQEIRLGQFGASFQLSTHSFALRDDDLPNELRLSGYGVTLGPRVFLALPFGIPGISSDRPIDIIVSIDYTRWGVSENRLADVTGLDLSFNAVGPTLGLSWQWGGLQVLGQGNYSQIFGWPGGVLTVNLMLGIGL